MGVWLAINVMRVDLHLCTEMAARNSTSVAVGVMATGDVLDSDPIVCATRHPSPSEPVV